MPWHIKKNPDINLKKPDVSVIGETNETTVRGLPGEIEVASMNVRKFRR